MNLTVAICTWNRAALLDWTLARMRELRIPDGVEWELLIVNNNCTDQTDAVIARHAGVLPIRRIFEVNPGLSNARNRALDEARGELIAWTDDDVLVEVDWLSSLVGAAGRHPEASGFGGPIAPWFPVPLEPAMAEAFPILKMGYCGLDYSRDEGSLAVDEPVFGANMAFRMSAVAGIRYDPRLGPVPRPSKLEGRPEISLGSGDDLDYVNSICDRGGYIIWVPGMRVDHYVSPERMTLVYLKSLYVEYGMGWIRINGVPGGPRILGAPRWIVRKWIEAGLRAAKASLTSPRSKTLNYTRERSYYYGMIRECRAIRRRDAPPRPRIAPDTSKLTDELATGIASLHKIN